MKMRSLINKMLPFLASALLLLVACAQETTPAPTAPWTFSPDGPLPLIPQPVEVERSDGTSFTLTPDTRVLVSPEDTFSREAAEQFVALLRESHGIALSVEETHITEFLAGTTITFRAAAPIDIAPEGYLLEIHPVGIKITAPDAAGAFYGAVSLWQLLGNTQSLPVRMPGLRIIDAPRFAWRGFMLDSSRYIQSVDHIKRLLDQMARHKLNTFHWHLTDDQGWRLEIKRYPRLTEVGAWRAPAGKAGMDANGNPVRYGGFYTQDEAREIVEYARKLHITVIPEIEMPGHAQSSIAAYPELGPTGLTPPVSSNWGVHPWLYNVEDSTFEFLQNVLLEVMDIFPGEYIHIGGDEAVKYQWQASPEVQAKLRELGLKDEDALQSWFVRRAGAFLAAHNRRLIGWDEILDGGPLPPGATIMSWRGMDGAIAAARAGHDAVLSPTKILYLNHVQSLLVDEPPGHDTFKTEDRLNTLETVYSFEPIPSELDEQQARHILGAQAHVWTEYVRTEHDVEYMTFPRLSAFAEVAWSPKDARDWKDFLPRLIVQMQRFSDAGIGAADSAFAVDIQVQPHPDGAQIILGNQTGFGELRYTLDGSQPDMHSTLYTHPLTVNLPVTIGANTFWGGKPLARPGNLYVDALTLRTRRPEHLAACPGDEHTRMLRLEDDEPLDPDKPDGKRAAVPVNVRTPCWYWPAAALDGIASVRVQAVDLPYIYLDYIPGDSTDFVPPPPGPVELEIRLNGCDSPVRASARVREQPSALKQIDVTLPAISGAHDLCLTFNGERHRTLWAIERVQLLTAQEM